ncbi:MAG: hypothetical protein ACOC4S_02160, partial [Balneolaceae bacterium]
DISYSCKKNITMTAYIRYSKFQFILPFLLIALTFNACNDSGGVEDSDPPEFPDLEQVSPDTEFFEDDPSAEKSGEEPAKTLEVFERAGELEALNFPETSQSEGFDSAGQFIRSLGLFVRELNSVAINLIREAKDTDYTYDEGVFVWEYSYELEGETVDIRLTADPNSEETEAYWTLSVTNDEFDSAVLLDGTTSYDGTGGEWHLYDITGESGSTDQPVLSLSWSVDGEENLTSEFTLHGAESGQEVVIGYEEDGDERWFTVDSEEDQIEIYWNEETREGYFQRSGETMRCWDSNLEETACEE